MKVRWKQLESVIIKINCDGAWNECKNRGGYGWVMRDFAGLLVRAGGSGGLIFNSTAMVETVAVRAAMVVCSEKGKERVVIESDALSIIQMIKHECVADASLEAILRDIWFLKTKFGEIDFSYVPRDGNLVAHAVAAHIASHEGSFL